MVRLWRLGFGAALLLTLGLVGCSGGDDDDDDAAEAKKPDTGAGAAQAVPATRTCADLCARLGACFEVLCNEDTKSTNYDGLGDLLPWHGAAGESGETREQRDADHERAMEHERPPARSGARKAADSRGSALDLHRGSRLRSTFPGGAESFNANVKC